MKVTVIDKNKQKVDRDKIAHNTELDEAENELDDDSMMVIKRPELKAGESVEEFKQRKKKQKQEEMRAK